MNVEIMDARVKARVEELRKSGYPHPIERASVENIPAFNLEKLHRAQIKIIKKRSIEDVPPAGYKPVKIRAQEPYKTLDTIKFVYQLVNLGHQMEDHETGLANEGIIIAGYCVMPLDKLKVLELETCKQIKVNKDKERVKYDDGRINNIIRDNLFTPDKR